MAKRRALDVEKLIIRLDQRRYRDAYAILRQDQMPDSLCGRVSRWTRLAREYVLAASALDTHPSFFLPMLHLAGHAIELSLKAYLLAVGTSVPRTHFLLGICDRASESGLVLEESERSAISDLSHFCFEDIATGSHFKVRYPTEPPEPCAGLHAPLPVYEAIVRALCRQATSRARVGRG